MDLDQGLMQTAEVSKDWIRPSRWTARADGASLPRDPEPLLIADGHSAIQMPSFAPASLNGRAGPIVLKKRCLIVHLYLAALV
jgi:hypothetical protein